MTTEKKQRKKATLQQPIASTDNKASLTDNIRLGLGLFFFALGLFLSVTIISYYFSWTKDQHLFFSEGHTMIFIFNSDAEVANVGGRLGAAMAHLLVYRSLGVAALIVALWIAACGINLIVAKPLIPVWKWVRWMALAFLFICPALAFLFPNTSLPLGGALGNGLVDWTIGFAGNIGAILTMILTFCFFVFVVFQWDIKPWFNKAKSIMPKSKKTMNPIQTNASPTINELNDQTSQDKFKGFKNYKTDEELAIAATQQRGNRLKSTEEETESILIADNKNIEGIEMTIIDTNHLSNDNEPFVTDLQEKSTDSSFADNEGIIQSKTLEQKKDGIVLELPPNVPAANEENDNEELTFEINRVQDESKVPANGAHITIESGEPYDPELDLPHFKFPTLDLLAEIDQGTFALDREELEQNKNQIINTLRSFGIEIQRISATVGPTVTLYEIVPAEGVRISKIRNLEDDIALNLAALGIRIIAPIPGKGTIGIEVPNKNKQIVSMRTLLSSDKFINNKMSLPIALGKKIDNENYIVDLATMPHLLMAGATGQGKSVGINAILISLLYKKHPSQLKFVMVDPKKVELSVYRLIEKHYLAMLPNEEEPIITDTKKVVNTLNALCIEMDNRYELLKDAGARNIKEYNEKFIQRRLNPNNGHKYLPFIVLVIDEFADLIMTAGKEVEMPIARLAQLARAVGIHIIIATQRPSVNVITGIIKANFPARIAFKVSAKVDSRTILDAGGADQLIGRGDMLVSNGSELQRLQCGFVDTPEVERIVEFIGNQMGYPSAFELPEYEGAEDEGNSKDDVDLTKRDKLFEECARLVVNSQSGSTSMLQRKLNIGFNRAGRIMDQLEAAEIVGPGVGSKPRDVYIKTEYELEQYLSQLP